MLIVQNGYECKEKLMVFVKLFFDQTEAVSIYTNFSVKETAVNVYTMILFEENTFFSDDYFSFSEEKCRDLRYQKRIFDAAVAKSFCHAAEKIRYIQLPWGVMSGIRPAKMVRELFDQGYIVPEVYEELENVYEIQREKMELAVQVAENERLLLKDIGDHSVSVYIGIPFCPTRCLYCSFVSTDIRVSGKYMEEYVCLLLEEIKKTAEIIHDMGCYVENIYIGGGTPTTLSAEQLEKILGCLKRYLIGPGLKEFTLEAGRPDTITEEKLVCAVNGGINRISINPQTMHDETLKRVGRTHDAQMVRDVFHLARRCGFRNINMDLIAGLPKETPEIFYHSLDEVIKLDPENITVHCMCVKRAANLRLSGIRLTEAESMNQMLSYTQKRMRETGREPYYMYRQKNISGNLENVGYAKPGTMSVYNINIMEEVQTIIALGGGGSTKIVTGDRIERVFNFKDPLEYIRRFDEILKKKDQILKIFKKNQVYQNERPCLTNGNGG